MSLWYDYNPNGSRIGMLLAGAAVGALVVGVAWFVQARGTSGDPEPSQGVVSTRSTDNEPATASEATSRLDHCQEVYDAQSGPLPAAADSLTQWEVHIGAMNQLVVGAITLEQAKQFWNQTRAGASLRLEKFAAAQRRFDQRTSRCPEPSPSAEVTPELRSCSRAVAARNRTLRLAADALETWQVHVHHMEMLRRGEMTAQEATRLWLQNWRRGDLEVRAYRAAARASDDQYC